MKHKLIYKASKMQKIIKLYFRLANIKLSKSTTHVPQKYCCAENLQIHSKYNDSSLIVSQFGFAFTLCSIDIDINILLGYIQMCLE